MCRGAGLCTEQGKPGLHQGSARSHGELLADSACLSGLGSLSLAQALPQALSWGDSCTRGWQGPGRATAVVVEPGTHGERVGRAGGMWGVAGLLEEHGGHMKGRRASGPVGEGLLPAAVGP